MMSSLIEAMVHYGTIDEHFLLKLWYTMVQFAKSKLAPLGYLISTFHPCRMRHHGSAISRLRSIVKTSTLVECTPCSDFELSSPQQRQERLTRNNAGRVEQRRITTNDDDALPILTAADYGWAT